MYKEKLFPLATHVPIPKRIYTHREEITPENPALLVDRPSVESAYQRKIERLFGEIITNETLVVPVAMGGLPLGIRMSNDLDIKISPLRASYYDEHNQRLPYPIIVEPLDPEIIANFCEDLNSHQPTVVITEAVVETGHTLEVVKNHIIKNFTAFDKHPKIVTEAYIIKTNNHCWPSDIRAEYVVDEDIWVQGLGCDDQKLGRERPAIYGRLSPYT